MGIETILPVALGLGGALIQGSAAKKAASTAAASADAATQSQLEMYYQNREDQAPWRQAGTWAINKLVGTGGTGPNAGGHWSDPVYEQVQTGTTYQPGQGHLYPDEPWKWTDPNPYQDRQVPTYSQVMAKPPEWVTDTGDQGGTVGLLERGPGEFRPEEEPGYKFGYQEFVEKPTLRAASATGSLQSGRTLRALSRYSSDYASTKYDNFLDRYYKSLDPYFRMAGLGSNVAVAGGNQAVSAGQGIAQSTLAGGQAGASRYINQGNIWGNAMSNTGQNILDYYYRNGGSQPMPTWGGSGTGWGGTTAGTTAGANQMIWS